MLKESLYNIIYDDDCTVRLIWQVLGVILAAAATTLLITWIFKDIIVMRGTSSADSEERRNYMAMCNSIGGTFGESKCYKDGKVVENDGGEE